MPHFLSPSQLHLLITTVSLVVGQSSHPNEYRYQTSIKTIYTKFTRTKHSMAISSPSPLPSFHILRTSQHLPLHFPPLSTRREEMKAMQEEEEMNPRSTTPYGIIRRSIHTFLQYYHLFAASPTLLAFPASATILLSQLFVYSSPTFRLLDSRLRSVFESAGFPPAASPFFSLLSAKLAQSISSSLFSLPFTLTFLIFTKSSIILLLSRRSAASFLRLYNPLLVTQMCSFFIILAANSAALSIMFLSFNLFHILGLSTPSLVLFLSSVVAVLYSIILANAAMICNLAVIVAGMGNCSGFLAIVKACVLIRGKVATALSLALPINLILAAVEALFQSRVVKAYHPSKELNSSFIWEPPLIVYLYATTIVLDTIISCFFYRSCKLQSLTDLELRNDDQMEYAEDNNNDNTAKNANNLQLFP